MPITLPLRLNKYLANQRWHQAKGCHLAKEMEVAQTLEKVALRPAVLVVLLVFQGVQPLAGSFRLETKGPLYIIREILTFSQIWAWSMNYSGQRTCWCPLASSARWDRLTLRTRAKISWKAVTHWSPCTSKRAKMIHNNCLYQETRSLKRSLCRHRTYSSNYRQNWTNRECLKSAW